MSIDVWIFNVGRGFCAAIKSPNGYLCLIDCGCSDEFPPVEWLAGQQWTPHKEHHLAKLIITHPHIDHLSDIENVTRLLPPAIIQRRKDLDWNKVTSGGSNQTGIMSHYVNTYMPPQSQYRSDATDPDWGNGFTLMSRNLIQAKVAEVSASDSAYVNNSSLVTILKYKNYNFAFTGDSQSEGMAALLGQSEDLCAAISSGVDFFITPHHGHPSGFSSEWFEIAGATNIANIAAERRKRSGEDESQTKVDSRYSQDAYCKGNNPEGRKLISTKASHIHIAISDDGRWSWEISR